MYVSQKHQYRGSLLAGHLARGTSGRLFYTLEQFTVPHGYAYIRRETQHSTRTKQDGGFPTAHFKLPGFICLPWGFNTECVSTYTFCHIFLKCRKFSTVCAIWKIPTKPGILAFCWNIRFMVISCDQVQFTILQRCSVQIVVQITTACFFLTTERKYFVRITSARCSSSVIKPPQGFQDDFETQEDV